MLMINLLLLTHLGCCKTVVLMPYCISSHAMTYDSVAVELATQGHQVHMFLPSAFNRRRDISTASKIQTYSYEQFFNITEDDIIEKVSSSLAVSEGEEPDWAWVDHFPNQLNEDYINAMKYNGLVDFVGRIKPDLIVIDFYPNVNALVALPYVLNIPFAVLSPAYSAVHARAPINILEETYLSYFATTQASNWEMFKKTMQFIGFLLHDFLFDSRFVSTIAKNKPYISDSDIMSRAEVYVVASDNIADYPRAKLPNIKFIGAVNTAPGKRLDDAFQSFMDRSHQGVVIVSFGSLVSSLPNYLVKKLVDSFSQLPLNVVWRINITSPDSNKILTSTWIPQNDLMAHKNTKILISHCGSHSQYEAIFHSMPVICVPLFVDQFYNAQRFEAKHISLTVNIWKDSSDTITQTVLKILGEEHFKKSISTMSEIHSQLYSKSKQEAAFWLNHVMKYGGDHMRTKTQRMPLSYYLAQYILFFLLGAFLSVVCGGVIFFLYRIVCFSINETKDKHAKRE